jgi:hypothetical protein
VGEPAAPWWAAEPAEPYLTNPDIAGVRRVGTAAIPVAELRLARRRAGLTARTLAWLIRVPAKVISQPEEIHLRRPGLTGRWLAACYAARPFPGGPAPRPGRGAAGAGPPPPGGTTGQVGARRLGGGL